LLKFHQRRIKTKTLALTTQRKLQKKKKDKAKDSRGMLRMEKQRRRGIVERRPPRSQPGEQFEKRRIRGKGRQAKTAGDDVPSKWEPSRPMPLDGKHG